VTPDAAAEAAPLHDDDDEDGGGPLTPAAAADIGSEATVPPVGGRDRATYAATLLAMTHLLSYQAHDSLRSLSGVD